MTAGVTTPQRQYIQTRRVVPEFEPQMFGAPAQFLRELPLCIVVTLKPWALRRQAHCLPPTGEAFAGARPAALRWAPRRNPAAGGTAPT